VRTVVLALLELASTAGKRGEILELLRYCADGLAAKPGCLGSGIFEAGDQHETILYLERWKSAEELHRHIQSNLYLGVLTAMDLASGPPDIRFYEVTDTKSMELIAALRSPGVA
jgi:quinol monooxygenase YgiN